MDCVTPPYWSILTVAIKSCHKYRNYTVFQSGTNSILQTLPPNIICYDQLLVELTFFTSKVSPSQQVQRESIHIWEMEKHQFIMKLFTGWSSLYVQWSTKWHWAHFSIFLYINTLYPRCCCGTGHSAKLAWAHMKTFSVISAVFFWIIQTCFKLAK